MRLTLPVTHHSGGLSETIVRLRERVETTSEEAVTGRYKDMTAHLSGRIGKAMLGQKAIDDVSNERTQLVLKESRLEIIQQSLTAIDDNIGQCAGIRHFHNMLDVTRKRDANTRVGFILQVPPPC